MEFLDQFSHTIISELKEITDEKHFDEYYQKLFCWFYQCDEELKCLSIERDHILKMIKDHPTIPTLKYGIEQIEKSKVVRNKRGIIRNVLDYMSDHRDYIIKNNNVLIIDI